MFDPLQHMHPDVGTIDLVGIAEHIASDNPAAARKVVIAIRDMFALLSGHPLLGTEYHPLRRTLKGIRMIAVTEYPNYLIYYRPLPENAGVRILYVLHGARDAAAFAKEHQRQ
ncbi:type II toxin-antitoxin system RelE/ParE family toxin [Prosthecobacter sp.]|uniref:type II toxin-antitoxin system RelE/ParE family toxin n=1 Tax=Prosthecobacter sp. TaxID=1965333 RepID=UPI003783B631